VRCWGCDATHPVRGNVLVLPNFDRRTLTDSDALPCARFNAGAPEMTRRRASCARPAPTTPCRQPQTARLPTREHPPAVAAAGEAAKNAKDGFDDRQMTDGPTVYGAVDTGGGYFFTFSVRSRSSSGPLCPCLLKEGNEFYACPQNPTGYTWSYLACRIGHVNPTLQPLAG
jgi:hypothetical protein